MNIKTIKKENIVTSETSELVRYALESVVANGSGRNAYIENYRGILEYTSCHILIQGKNCQICFEGKGLYIDYYTNEDMKISGCISCIQYI